MDQKSDRFHMRVSPDFGAKLDEWRRYQPDLPSRSESIRRLVEVGLIGSAFAASPATLEFLRPVYLDEGEDRITRQIVFSAALAMAEMMQSIHAVLGAPSDSLIDAVIADRDTMSIALRSQPLDAKEDEGAPGSTILHGFRRTPYGYEKEKGDK